MPKPTKFQNSWLVLDKKDKNGHLVKQWCQVGQQFSLQRILHSLLQTIQNQQHWTTTGSGQKHTEIAKARFGSQLGLAQKEKNEAACAADTTVVS